MKKLIYKFYGINFLISIALFFTYRIAFIGKNTTTQNWFSEILYILDIWLNIHFAMVYLIVMIFGSLTFFLNLIAKIRNNYLLSLLTFLGIPLISVGYLIITDHYSDSESPMTTLVSFSIIYLFFITIEFLLFRKKLKNMNRKLIP